MSDEPVSESSTVEMQTVVIDQDPPVAEFKSYYDILNVPTDSNPAQISVAFKKLSMVYHPDRNSDDESAAIKLQQVNEAYQCLNDRSKRIAYDTEVLKIQSSVDNSATDSSLVGMVKSLATVAIRAATTLPLFTAEFPPEVLETAKAIVT